MLIKAISLRKIFHLTWGGLWTSATRVPRRVEIKFEFLQAQTQTGLTTTSWVSKSRVHSNSWIRVFKSLFFFKFESKTRACIKQVWKLYYSTRLKKTWLSSTRLDLELNNRSFDLELQMVSGEGWGEMTPNVTQEEGGLKSAKKVSRIIWMAP